MIDYIFGLVTGLALMWVILSRKGWLTRPNPYRYICLVDGCPFEATSNRLDVLDSIATNHERMSHPDRF